MNTPLSQTLTHFLDDNLPVAQFMGINVEDYNSKALILSAPLEPNINDKLTAFGGSLYNLAVMACWGMIYLKTKDAGINCNLVVTQGNIQYKSPVQGALRATCKAPDEATFTAFIDTFKQHKKAKISLTSTVEYRGEIAVEFRGEYAILPP